MKTLYRAEGDHSQPGYAGTVDDRTGRYFGTLERALAYCTDDRHLYEVQVSEHEALLLTGSPEDQVLLSPEQAARKQHSPLCPCEPPLLYHGTRKPFTKNGYLFPVSFHKSEARPGHTGDDSTDYAYVTTDHEMAEWYAMQTPGRGKPRVLTVVPTGPVEEDPSTYDNERYHQFRSKSPFRVVAVEVLSAWDQAQWADALIRASKEND